MMSCCMTAMLMQSCYSEIDLGDIMGEPSPVINAVASPDTVVLASVSRTYSYDEQVGDLFIKDADVSLYVNGKFYEKMQGKEIETEINIGGGGASEALSKKWVYVSDYTPSPGDEIKIEAATRIGTADVAATVPQPADIDGVTTDITRYDDNYFINAPGYDVTYHVKINDKPGESNYYMLGVQGEESSGWRFFRIYLTDPVFEMQNQDITDIGGDTPYTMWVTVFDDTLFDGTSYDLTFEEKAYDGYNTNFDPDENKVARRKVILYTITEDYYKYMRSILKDMKREDSDLGDLGLYEPVFIYNAVNGGAGAMCAQSSVSTILEIN